MSATIIHAAILAAADHIEANPNLLRFSEVDVPTHAQRQACVLGWLHYFSGIQGARNSIGIYVIEARNIFPGFADDGEFYRLMAATPYIDWRDDAADCARALRKIAEWFNLGNLPCASR
jgi:hypothetical protein